MFVKNPSKTKNVKISGYVVLPYYGRVNLVHFFYSAFVRKMVRVPKMEITSRASAGEGGGGCCVCVGVSYSF